MVRSALALVAAVILTGFTLVQQVATHTVVRGDTLWDLAQTYYGNPWQWRRIWNANRDRISDPNLILPGWVLTIPGKQAEVGNVTVQPSGAAKPSPTTKPQSRTRAPLPSVSEEAMAHRPTVFREKPPARGSVVPSVTAPHLAVSRDEVYSAPWLVRVGREPEFVGTLEGIAEASPKTKDPHRFEDVRLRFSGSPPAVGASLRVFRITKTIPDVGQVVTPTAVVRISTVEGDSAVGSVTQEYHRIQPGDMLGALPAFSLTPGEYAQEVTGGSEAMIMGFAGTAVIQADGEVAFLDQGRDDGVSVGDEYQLVNPALGSHAVEGLLRVVSVTTEGASARIVQVRDPAAFQQGVAVRLSRKMR